MAEKNRARKGRRVLGCGCLVLLLVLGAFGVVLQRSSSRRLDEAHAQLTVDIEAFEERLRAEPRTLLGAPVEGDAYPWYALIEYVLAPTPPEWQPRPAWMPPCALSADHPGVNGHDLSVLAGIADSIALGKQAISPLGESLCVVYAPVHQAVREALRRTALAWPADLRDGFEARLPNLFALRTVAHLLEVTGALGSAEEEATCGVEIVALGRDVARAPFLISAMIGVAIQNIGVRTLVRGLRRGLSLDALERLEPLLAGLGGSDERRVIEGELLGMKAGLLLLSGRPQRDGAADADFDQLEPLRFDVVAAYELGVFEDFAQRTVEPFELPYGPARDKLWMERDRALAEAWSLVVPILGFGAGALDAVTGARASLACARVAVAIHRHWKAHGRPPESLEALGLPPQALLDPYGGAPLVYRAWDDRVLLYSIGEDLADSGGRELVLPWERDRAAEIGLELRAP